MTSKDPLLDIERRLTLLEIGGATELFASGAIPYTAGNGLSGAGGALTATGTFRPSTRVVKAHFAVTAGTNNVGALGAFIWDAVIPAAYRPAVERTFSVKLFNTSTDAGPAVREYPATLDLNAAGNIAVNYGETDASLQVSAAASPISTNVAVNLDFDGNVFPVQSWDIEYTI